MDMMGMLNGKLERDQTGRGSGLIWPVCCCCCCLFVCLIFFNEKTINDALNMGTNFGFPSQGGPRRPLPCFFFFSEKCSMSIVYLAGTLPPAPISEVCVCPW